MGKTDRVLMVALAASLLANVGLTFMWRQSRGASSSLSKSRFDERTLPHVGARLDELHLLGLSGEKPDLNRGVDAPPTVAYVLSPTCRWCELNRPDIDSLATQMRGRYRFIGVSTTSKGLADYVAQKAPPFPIYYVDPSSPHPSFQLSATPETLVFSPGGAFVRGWNGAYLDDTKASILSFFGVALPDISK